MYQNNDAAQKLAAMLIVILLSSGSMGMLFTVAQASGDGDFPPPESGDWIITSPTNVSNEVLYLSGNILIRNGGILHLENVDLIFNSTRDGEFRLDVENGGQLYMYNSTVDRGTDFTYGLRQMDGGSIRVENSEIRRCGFNAWNYYGLTLYGDDAVIRNNLFTQGYIGLYSYVSQGHEISGNSFINNSYIAVYFNTVTDFQVSSNLMDHNNYGVYLLRSAHGTVEGNEVRNTTGHANRIGIMAHACDDIMIRDNVVNDTAEALYTHTSTNITFLNNQASNSTRGIRCYSSQHITMDNNLLLYNIHGIYADVNNVNLTIQDNNASFSSSYNMYLYRVSDSVIQRNDIKNVTVYYGIALRECSQVQVTDNIITGNADRGLWFWDSNNLTARYNTISGSNIGFYGLRSKDNLFADGDIQHNNYGIYFDGCTKNIIENSTSLNNNNQDIYLRGATTELLLLNSIVDSKSFDDEPSEYTERFYLQIEMLGRTGPVSGVDVEVLETLTDTVIYSTPAFGGTDDPTDEGGTVSWIAPLYSFNNMNGTTLSQVRIRVNDHGIFQDETYAYIEQEKTVTFIKSALTVDKAGNGDYTTIGEAIAAADSGDSILVAAGTYQENLVIDKDLEIYGKGSPVIIDASGGTAFLIQGNTTLGNFTITNASLDFDIQGNTFVHNVTFTTRNLDATHHLAVGYYLNIRTVDENQDPLSRVNVTISNLFFEDRSYESDPNGWVMDVPLTDFADTSSNHWDLNPYTINGTLLFRSGSTNLSIHGNMDLFLNLTRHGAFGSSVITGDLNHDGHQDYVVGAPLDDEGSLDAGAVFIYWGPQTGVEELRPIDADLVLNGERIHSWYGSSLELGDVNGDGLQDLIVGAPGYNSTGANGLLGYYWNSEDFTEFEYTRIDATIDFPWGNDNPPQVGNSFSINWSGYLYVTVEDDYTFSFEHDDGVRMYLNGNMVIEAWTYDGQEASHVDPIHLTPGYYPLDIEFYDGGGQARLIMKWETPEMEKQVISTEHLFYTIDMNPGNGAVYIYSGEIIGQKDITATSGSRQDGLFPSYGHSLSTGDIDIDGKDDIFVGFEGGTQVLFGNIMLYHEDFYEEPILSSEWDPMISGLGGDIYIETRGILTLDTSSDADAYAYVMSREILDRGIGFTVTQERGDSAMFLTGIDYKVPRTDVSNLTKQEDHTLFSLYASGQIKCWPTFGGSVQIENPNIGNRQKFSFTVLVNPDYDHMWIYLDGELQVDTPISGWGPVYLKLGDSSTFGMATIRVLEFSPTLLNRTIAGMEGAMLLDNDQRSLAASVLGDTYLFSVDLDDYFQTASMTREDFSGEHNYTTFNDGLTISPFYPIDIVSNGDFDNGWDNWTQTENIRDKNNADWHITTEERGDWLVYDGPTAGLGPDRDEVNSGGYNGRDCDGKLVSEPFLILPEVKYIDFWYHAKWWSFELETDNNQDDFDDMIIYRLVRESNGRTIAEQIFRKPPADGEEEGRLQFSVGEYEGEYLIFEMEQVTNYAQYDDGLAQVDDITGAKENEELAGDFISDPMTFNRTFNAFSSSLQGDDHGGNITLSYRTDGEDPWTSLPDGLVVLGETATEFQYMVEFEGVKGNPYPVIEALRFTFYNTTPVYIQPGRSVDAGGILENHTLGVIDGSTLTLYQGPAPRMEITADEDIVSVSSPGDIDRDTKPDLLVTTGDSAYLFLLDAVEDRDVGDTDYHFQGEAGFGSSLDRTLVGSPLERTGDGRAYVLPIAERNLALVSLNLDDGSLIYPQTIRTLVPIVKNTGLQRLENVGLKLEITAPSYSHQETILVSLDPGDETEVPFTWIVPGDEGVVYTIRFTLDPDQLSKDNTLELSVTTRYHALSLSTMKEYDVVAQNGTASYRLKINNFGTLGEDEVTFDMDLPGSWEWWVSRSDVNFTSLKVTTPLTFILNVRTDSPLGVYPVTLMAVSENGTTNATQELVVHIVDRDILPTLVTYLREDGKVGTPVSGENTTIVLTLQNIGTEAVDPFDTTLYLDDEPILVGYSLGIQPNGQTNITFHVTLLEGSHTLRFTADEEDLIREYNEHNNEITSQVDVKPEISAVPFLFRVHVIDQDGMDFPEARIRISSGSTIIENITDGNGMSHLIVESYPEGEIFLVEALSGQLYASVRIAVYSEDVEAVIELMVGRYSFLMSCDSRDKEIDPGSDQTFTINLTNTGDLGDNYTISFTGLPVYWDADISGVGLADGVLQLGKDAKTTITVSISSWIYAPAHQRYEFTFTVSSLVSPTAVKEMLLRTTVTVNENITVSTEDPVEHGLPRDPISHRIYVTNNGNAQREVTLMVTGDVEYSSLNKHVITLVPGNSEEVLLVIVIPNMRAGTVLNHEFYGIISGVGTTPSIHFTTSIDASSGQYMKAEIQGRTLVITNNGNTMNHIEITADTHLADITLHPGSIDVDMGETVRVDMEVEMLDLTIPAGTLINVFISLYNGNIYFINSSRSLVVPEVYALSLKVDDTIIHSPPGSNAVIEVLVRNLGNVEQSVFFTGTIDGDETLQIPAPVTIARQKEIYVYPSVRTSDDAHGQRNITLTAMSKDIAVSLDLILDLEVFQDIELQEISAREYRGGTRYTINLVNNGDIDELVRIQTNCGELDREVAEVPADDYIQFHLFVTGSHVCPDTILISALSEKGAGISSELELVPPPMVTIQVLSPLPATVTEPVILQASGSYSSYLWTIQGKNVLGSKIYYNFTRSGIHSVELKVRDHRGLSSTYYLEIPVQNSPPIIETARTIFGDTGVYINLDARESYDPDGTIEEFRWTIENTSFFGPNIHHIFTLGGTYTVTLRVTDNEGAASTAEIMVTVRDTGSKNDNVIKTDEIDTEIAGISGALLLVLIGLIAFMYIRMNREEESLVRRLKDLEAAPSMAPVPGSTLPPPGSRACSRCGHFVPGNFKFCNRCGSAMEEGQRPGHPAVRAVFCTQCGSQVPGNYKFCNKCGSPMDDQEVAS